MAFSEETFF